MPIIQLPTADPLDLSTRAAFIAWNQEPRRQSRDDRIGFWTDMTGLTLPQEIALRLGRTQDQVSTTVVQSTFERRAVRLHEPTWAYTNLKQHQQIWARTHSATLFRVVPGGGAGRMGPNNPLRPLLAWAEPDDIFEDRFLMAGYGHGWSYRRRRDHVRRTLRDAACHDYIAIVGSIDVPARVWTPHRQWCSDYGVVPPRLKVAALDHGALAVEAALMRQGYRDTTAAIVALHSEAALTSRARRCVGGRVQIGAQFESQPDLKVVTRAEACYAVEVISHNYRNAALKAKHASLQGDVEFVATSRTLARRVVKAVPHATCYHF